MVQNWCLCADQEGIWDTGQVLVGVCEQQTNLNPIQIMPEDPSEDLKIREHKQGHGEEGF